MVAAGGRVRAHHDVIDDSGERNAKGCRLDAGSTIDLSVTVTIAVAAGGRHWRQHSPADNVFA